MKDFGTLKRYLLGSSWVWNLGLGVRRVLEPSKGLSRLFQGTKTFIEGIWNGFGVRVRRVFKIWNGFGVRVRRVLKLS